jgi:hypothetical protein
MSTDTNAQLTTSAIVGTTSSTLGTTSATVGTNATVETTSATVVPTTTSERTLTNEEKMELYNTYKSELNSQENLIRTGAYSSSILFGFSLVIILITIEPSSNRSPISGFYPYSKVIMVVYIIIFILLIISVILAGLALLKKSILTTNEFKANYKILLSKAENSDELINLYESIIGKESNSKKDAVTPSNLVITNFAFFILNIVLTIGVLFIFLYKMSSHNLKKKAIEAYAINKLIKQGNRTPDNKTNLSFKEIIEAVGNDILMNVPRIQ